MRVITAMKKVRRSGGSRWELPTEEEVDIAGILCTLRKRRVKSEVISGHSFAWGMKKKRSVLDSISESFAQEEKSPSTPLCFVPSGGTSGSDGSDKGKAPLHGGHVLKRKGTDDLIEVCNRMQQENEIFMKQLKCMETLHEELTYENLEPKAKGQKINYPNNKEDYRTWNNSMKASDQQRCNQQITMFASSTPQLVVDPTHVASCSTNSNGDGRFGLFNQIHPRVKIHGETYDFMGSSKPLDQSKFMVMDNELRVRVAAAARKRRKLKMKLLRSGR